MMTLAHSTRIAFQVIIDDDTGTIASFLAALTMLIGLLLAAGQLVSSVALFVSDFIEAGRFTSTVFIIAFKALAFGIGIHL